MSDPGWKRTLGRFKWVASGPANFCFLWAANLWLLPQTGAIRPCTVDEHDILGFDRAVKEIQVFRPSALGRKRPLIPWLSAFGFAISTPLAHPQKFSPDLPSIGAGESFMHPIAYNFQL